MSKKLTAAVFLILCLVLISWLISASAEEKKFEDKEAQIHELRGKIKELEYALEREENVEKAKELKNALTEHKRKLDKLMKEFRKAQKPRWEFPEIQMAIERSEAHLKELRHATEALQEEGVKPENVEKLQKGIAQKEAELEELVARLENRRAEREKELEDKESQIRELKEKVQQLKNEIKVESVEKAKELKAALKEHVNKLERLMADFRKAQKPKWEFPEINIAIQRTKGQLEGLRQVAGVLKEGDEPEKLEEMQQKIAQKETELEELTARLEKRRAEMEQKKAKARSRLIIVSLKHANALNLSEVIEKFLTHEGIIAADPDSNSLVIKDSPAGLEVAMKIIKELDVPKKRIAREQVQRRREVTRRRRREGVSIGKVLKAGADALTIETEEGKKKITLYVPLRKKEDGTQAPVKELSLATAALEVGSIVRVQWRRGEEKLWIKKLTKVEKEP